MGKKKTVGRYLTEAEIHKFKNLLLEKRGEILGNVESMENDTLKKERTELSNLPLHMGDVGSDNYEMENTLGLMDSERKLLIEIEEALQRIEDGTYGICQGSGKPISRSRMKAIPWAKYCVEYANFMEKGRAQANTSINYSKFGYTTDEQQDREDSGLSYQKVGII